MLLSAFPPQTPPPATHSNYCFTPVVAHNYNTSAQRPLSLAATTASTALGQVSFTSDDDASSSSHDEDSMVSSAAAIAAALRDASTSPVEFVHRIEKGDGVKSKAMVLPSQDFQRLCLEQLDLFRRIVHPDALLSVFAFVH